MKKRNGFVSNSSTSSFVIIGYFIEDTGFASTSEMEDAGLGYDSDITYVCDDGGAYAGYVLYRGDSIEAVNIDFKLWEEKAKLAKEKLKATTEPRLIAGTIYC